MDFEQIKELIKLVDESQLAFFEIDTQNEHIKMDKSTTRGITAASENVIAAAPAVKAVQSTAAETIIKEAASNSTQSKNEEKDEEGITVITSPMVGTYYSKPSPDSDSFVNVGDAVKKGKIICIIEAMKLMNEIESEYDGTITECLVSDGDMVEYGQPLFKIKEA